jgi:hypothetical protein
MIKTKSSGAWNKRLCDKQSSKTATWIFLIKLLPKLGSAAQMGQRSDMA